MAQPITLRPMPHAATGIETAPPTPAEKHADAVESAYELLQLLHDRGVLDLLRDSSVRETSDRHRSAAVNTPESVRAIRNFLLLTQFFGSIKPEVLNNLVQAVTEAPSERSRTSPELLQLLTEDCAMRTPGRLAVTLDLVESVGKRALTPTIGAEPHKEQRL